MDDVRRLFHALDPLPYREKDLDPEVEAFVVDWARELRPQTPLEIVIHAPTAGPDAPGPEQVEAAMRTYFAGRAAATRRQHRELLKTGRTSLVIGLSVLAACSIAARIAVDLWPGDFGQFLAEGLIILGWVANWRPIEIFLYDWWPLVRRRRLLDRLSHCDVRIEPHARPQTKDKTKKASQRARRRPAQRRPHPPAG